jgi:6-phosphogluconolactonase (cycloisomerase 2 family)
MTSLVVGSFCAPLKVYSLLEDSSLTFQTCVENSGPSPSYFVNSPCNKYLYAIQETQEAETSSVESYQIVDGKLQLISRCAAVGRGTLLLVLRGEQAYHLNELSRGRGCGRAD